MIVLQANSLYTCLYNFGMIELYFENFDIVKTSAREENKHIEGNLDAFTRVPTIAVITEHYYETRAVNAMMTNKHSDSISVQFIGRLL